MPPAGPLPHDHLPSSRGFQHGFVAPHHAATVQENASARRFVVDSWFHDNGRLPVVMPVEIWEKGWYPSTIRLARRIGLT